MIKICKYESCHQKHDSHGYCANHARQYRKYGHPLSAEEIHQRKSDAKKGNLNNLGKNWTISPDKRHKGITRNTGKTHFVLSATLGNNNVNWKGDDVGYFALHSWVKRHLGRPNKCQHCGLESNNPNMIQWANKSWEYKRTVNDWLRLCAKCHSSYDRKKLSLIEIQGDK